MIVAVLLNSMAIIVILTVLVISIILIIMVDIVNRVKVAMNFGLLCCGAVRA
jgi:hypothetical protein